MLHSQSRFELELASMDPLGEISAQALDRLPLDILVSQLIRKEALDLSPLGMRVLGLDRGG